MTRRAVAASAGFLFPVADAATTQVGLNRGAVEANSLARFAQETIGLWPYSLLVLGPVFAVAGMLAAMSLPYPTSLFLRRVLAAGCVVSFATYGAVLVSNVNVIAGLS